MKQLSDYIKKIDGSVLGIGLKEKYIDLIEKNNKITKCDLLNSSVKTKNDTGKKEKLKKINIKKLKKEFKNGFNYIICDYESIEKYTNSFVDNSISISDYVVFFNYEEKIIKKYNRYGLDIKKNNGYIVIDCRSSSGNPIKKYIYNILDIASGLIEAIGDLLMN